MPALDELLRGIEAEYTLPPGTPIDGVAPFDTAGPGQLTFAMEAKLAVRIATCHATAILVARSFPSHDLRLIRVGDPKAAFLRIAPVFAPVEPRNRGIHPTAIVEPDVDIGQGVSIGALAYVGAGARIGPRTWICPQVTVGPGVEIGADCVIRSGARVERFCRIGDRCVIHGGAVIGSDGFGFTPGPRGLEKEPQLGIVQLGDDVEVGANTTIDRSMIPGTATTIGDGTKIDNLVQIGHNCRIGRYCVIVSQVGISGSVTIGDGVQIAGQTGVRDHVTIGDGVRLAGRAGVTTDVPEGATFSGFPAQDHRVEMRLQAALRKVPALRDRIQELDRRIEALELDKSQD